MIPKLIEQGEGRRELAFPLFVLGLLLLAWTPSCGAEPSPPAGQSNEALRLQGPTMGTTWSASLHGADPEADWQTLLQAELDKIEAALTTWNSESELMQLNAASEAFAVGPLVHSCLLRAQTIASATQGAFDPTVQPLVTLWGFGQERDLALPSQEMIADARSRMGWDGFAFSTLGGTVRVIKTVPGLQIDLSGFAKGWAADRLAKLVKETGCEGSMIEVGGEIRISGDRAEGGPWRIGVEAPAEHPGAPRVMETILSLRGGALSAVATSGDSRNRRTIGDYTFSHILDPRTGWPVEDPPASVTVIAADCATADAWATALMVLGPEEGLPLAEIAGLEVCFQMRMEDGSFRERATEGYEALVAERLNR